MATERACFLSLAADFGPEFVTIYRGPEDVDALFKQRDWLAARGERQLQRRAALENSKYGLNAVRASFEDLVLRSALREEDST